MDNKYLAPIVLALLATSAYSAIEINSHTYFCEAENSIKECLRISESGITCYTSDGADRCVGGKWIPVEEILNTTIEKNYTTVCGREGCFECETPINAYSNCKNTINRAGEIILP